MYAKSTRPSAKRDDQIARPRRTQACARWECAREAGRFFNNKLSKSFSAVQLISNWTFKCIWCKVYFLVKCSIFYEMEELPRHVNVTAVIPVRIKYYLVLPDTEVVALPYNTDYIGIRRLKQFNETFKWNEIFSETFHIFLRTFNFIFKSSFRF